MKEEIRFLEGPQSRWQEFFFVLKTLREFVKGFRHLHFVGPCVTVFGSARFEEGHKYYELTRKLGSEIARLGFTVLTGGGPGLMEAANRGAKDVGGRSVGCNIILNKEQHPNMYLDKWVTIRYFFVRKTLLIKYSYAFIVMPGGFGTMDELFEAVTLIQTHKISEFPVIVIGKEYYLDLLEQLEVMKKSSTISEIDSSLIFFTDSIDEAIEIVREKSIVRFGLQSATKLKPSSIFGERNHIAKKPKAG